MILTKTNHRTESQYWEYFSSPSPPSFDWSLAKKNSTEYLVFMKKLKRFWRNFLHRMQTKANHTKAHVAWTWHDEKNPTYEYASTGARNIKNSPVWNKGFMWENPVLRLKHIVKGKNLGNSHFFLHDEKYS